MESSDIGVEMPQDVLVVDDSIPLHKLIAVHLSENGMKVHSAYSGATGLEMAASLQPDLVLLDVDMPEMNGFDVCRLLKSNPVTSDIPIIFLTAASSVDEKICGFELQAVDYITKPFVADELGARVRVALRTKRLLDLLPKSTQPVAGNSPGMGVASLNARLSMAHLMRSRAENPWNRKPPASAGDTAQPRATALTTTEP